MKQKIRWFGGFIALSFIMVIIAAIVGNSNIAGRGTSAVAVTKEEKPVTVVIDAGHGGEDGGCVAADGTLEKDLNLYVSETTAEILRAAGLMVDMSRDEDKMLYNLYGDLEDYSGVKKTYDLKNRVRFAKESECSLFVSIHMNRFTDSKYSGLQVYYSNNESDSIDAALRIKEYIAEYLQPDNDREIKRAGSNIYVLHRAQMPAVLVECGFLSNEAERELLKDVIYRKKLSLCLGAAIADSVSNFES